ncbi:MAG: thiamine phosphate synthase [Bauldia sp.]
MAEIGTVDPAVVDYVGLGPVFATATKADAAPVLGLDGTRAIGLRLALPYVAIGGIDADNAAAVDGDRPRRASRVVSAIAAAGRSARGRRAAPPAHRRGEGGMIANVLSNRRGRPQRGAPASPPT